MISEDDEARRHLFPDGDRYRPGRRPPLRARTVEDQGCSFLATFEHVLGVDPDRPGWEGSFDYQDTIHEPFTLFGFLTEATDTLRLATAILVLPQR